MKSSWRIESDRFLEEKLAGLTGTLIDLGAGNDNYGQNVGSLKRISVDTGQRGRVDVIADITKPLPFKEEADAVLLSNVLEHIAFPQPLVNECYRILKPGGKLVITVLFLCKLHQVPVDFNRYTKYMLAKLLKNAGFENYKITQLGNSSDAIFSLVRGLYHPLIYKTLRLLLPKRNSRYFPLGYGIEAIK